MDEKELIERYEKQKIKDEEKKKQENIHKNKSAVKKIMEIAIILVFIYVILSFGLYLYRSYEQKINIQGLEKQYENIYTDGNCLQKNIDSLEYMINNNIPDATKKEVIDNGWIIVIAKDIKARSNGGLELLLNKDSIKNDMKLRGLTVPLTKIIFIYPTKDKHVFRESSIHELGHVTSYKYNYAHGTLKFHNLYEKYRDTYNCEEYDKTIEAEFFAECCKDYILQPSILKRNNREIYDYFNNLFKNDKENNNPIQISANAIAKTVHAAMQIVYLT